MELTMTISECLKNRVEGQVRKFAKKAIKYGLGGISVDFKNKGFVEKKNGDSSYLVRVLELIFKFDTPVIKVNGWTFIARLQHLNTGNLLFVVPDQILPENYRESQMCEHCGIDRFRKETYVLKNEQGEFKQVGSTCLKDFLGVDVQQALKGFEFFDELNKNFESVKFQFETETKKINYDYDLISLDSVLLATAYVLRNEGKYITKNEATQTGKHSTTSLVSALFFNSIPFENTDEDRQLVNDVKMWMSNLTLVPSQHTNQWSISSVLKENQYFHNLITMYKEGGATVGSFATLVSAVYSYQVRHRKNMGIMNSQHVGIKGDKIALKVKVLKANPYENRFGNAIAYTLLDENGNVFVWFNSSEERLHIGLEYEIAGTVKDHITYRTQNQTVLTRVKVGK